MAATLSRSRVDPLEGLLRELREGQQRIDAKLDLLLTRFASGPRDDVDVALVSVITACSKGLPFTTAGLWRRAAGDVVLADALADADIDNPQQLGKLLKRLDGLDVNGRRISRAGGNREGAVWVATVQE